jgi:hypothetical protein
MYNAMKEGEGGEEEEEECDDGDLIHEARLADGIGIKLTYARRSCRYYQYYMYDLNFKSFSSSSS